jgi:hypothetical protein
LLALDSRGWRLFDSDGRLLVKAQSPGGAILASASFVPRGRTLALVETQTGGEVVQSGGGRVPLTQADRKLTGLGQTSRVVLVQPDRPRKVQALLLTVPGTLDRIAWSPNGRSLLVGWRDADQWLFLHPTPDPKDQHLTSVSNVGRQFAPGGPARAAFPQPLGWCCTR